jgi:hypothetical protein
MIRFSLSETNQIEGVRDNDLDDRRRDRPNQICHALPGQNMKYELFTRVALKGD